MVNCVSLVYFSATKTTQKNLRAIAEGIGLPVKEYDFTLPQNRSADITFGPDELVLAGAPVYGGVSFRQAARREAPTESLRPAQGNHPRQPPLQGARRFQPNGPGKCQRLHPLWTVRAQLPGQRHRCRGPRQGGRQQVPAVPGLRAPVPNPLQAVHLGRLQRFGRVVPLHLQGAPQGTGIVSVNHLKNPA